MRESSGLTFRIALAFDEGQVLDGRSCAVFDESYKQKKPRPSRSFDLRGAAFWIFIF
jgi:hypothetical protein